MLQDTSGLYSLLSVMTYHKISADPEQIIHKFALRDKENLGDGDIIRIAKEYGFKARLVQNCKMPLEKMPLPCILQDRGGLYFILAKASADQVLIMRPSEKVPVTLSISQFKEEWNKKAVFLKHIRREHRDMQFGISWFLVTVLQYKEQFVEVLVASFTLQLLGLFSPIIMQVVIDKVLVHNSLTTLDVLVVGLFAIIFFETLMNIARNYVFTNTTSKIDVILGDRLLKHLIHLPLAYFENRRTGVTIARVRELENIRRFLTGTPLTTVMDLMFVLVYIVVMLFYSKDLTFIVLASLPLFVLLSLLSMPAFKKRLDEKFAAGAEYQSYLVETITGVNTIKSLALEPDIQKKWGSLLAGYTKASYKTSILSGNINSIGGFIQKGFDLLILWMGAKLVISGEITVGQMIAFRMLSGRVSAPILRLVQLWQDFQQTKVSIDRIGDIFSVKQELDISQAKSRLPQIQGSIVFENVTFRYKVNSPEAISTMSFKIPPGKVIGIVGRSGSGKSTLTKLIQRLYIPETGKIMVDGVDISITDIEWLRRQIGVVLQENFLFNMTIRENICVNDPGASVEKMVEVCKIAGAHDFIVEMPGAYDTLLGENGTGLSGGQKQRLAIARALMDNPRILIFDEATSALDYESESIINANLKHICKGRTVLIIAHRLSIMRNADAIMVVDRGKLVEFNTQEKLLAQKGLYHYLYNQQFANAQETAVTG